MCRCRFKYWLYFYFYTDQQFRIKTHCIFSQPNHQAFAAAQLVNGKAKRSQGESKCLIQKSDGNDVVRYVEALNGFVGGESITERKRGNERERDEEEQKKKTKKKQENTFNSLGAFLFVESMLMNSIFINYRKSLLDEK